MAHPGVSSLLAPLSGSLPCAVGKQRQEGFSSQLQPEGRERRRSPHAAFLWEICPESKKLAVRHRGAITSAFSGRLHSLSVCLCLGAGEVAAR